MKQDKVSRVLGLYSQLLVGQTVQKAAADRIKTMEVEKETFRIPYNRRFQEGEFRKHVQFMYGGRLQRVTFTYTGYDIDAILDRLPMAKILSEDDGTYQLEAVVCSQNVAMIHLDGGLRVTL